MPITWNDEVLKQEQIDKLVNDYLPKTKSKIVTFSRMNAQPFRAIGKGKMLQKMGGEHQIPASCRTTLPDLGDGIIRYYKSFSDIRRGGNSYKEYTPNFVTFFSHSIAFDASKDKALFLFLLYNSKSDFNSGRTGEVPEFRFVQPTEASKKTVAMVQLENKAISKVIQLQETNKKQIRAFYESLGFTDYKEKEELKQWDDILAPIFDHCKKNPEDALAKMDDAALELVSKVVQAHELGVIRVEADAIYWGDGIKQDIKKRKITNIPKGKGTDWADWFAFSYLRSESDVASELTVELKQKQIHG